MSRPYSRSMPSTWWLTNRAYFFFIVRELTSVFIAIYVVLLLILISRIAAGPDAYRAYLSFLATPGMLAFHLIALAGALYHSITWFSLAPKGLVVRFAERRVPDVIIAGTNFAAWLLLTLVIAWFVL